MSLLSFLSAGLTPATEAKTAFDQGKQDKAAVGDATSLRMVEQLRKAQEAEEQAAERRAAAGDRKRNIDSQIKTREASKLSGGEGPPRNIDRLSPEGIAAELDLARGLQGARQTQDRYEEKPERGGVAIYKNGEFQKWKVTPPSERGSDAGLTRTLSRESKLRDDYQSDPVVKNAYGVANAAAQIRAAAQNVNNPQGDLDIIYQVVKIRDPNSVVREGEIDLQRAARSLGTQVSLAWEKAKSGRMLSPDERRQIVELVGVKEGAMRQQIAPIQKTFGAASRKFGADSAFVAPDPFSGSGGSGGLDIDNLIRSTRQVPPKKPGG